MSATSEQKTLAGRLTWIQHAIAIAITDPTISVMLDGAGYDVEVLSQGRTLHKQATTLQHVYVRAHAEYRSAAVEGAVSEEHAQRVFMRLLETARLALADDQAALPNYGPGELPVGWAQHATRFYSTVLASPAMLERMAYQYVTADDLRAGLESVARLAQTRHALDVLRVSARQATEGRDQSMEHLNNWMADFTVVAKIVLIAHPRLLSRMGFVLQ